MKRLGWLAAAAATFAAPPAHAEPQATAGLTLGGALADLRTAPGAAFHLGLRSEVLFLRNGDSDMGLGPYVDASTAAFDSLELGGGLAWLIPWSKEIPLVVSAGGLARHTTPFGWEPGIASTVYLGGRSFNYTSRYSLGIGGFVQGRYGLGEGKQADVIFGVQLDLSLAATVFVTIVEALRH